MTDAQVKNKIKNAENRLRKLENELGNNSINHVLHLILSIFTGGLWLIVWLFIGLFHSSDNGIINKITKVENEIDDLYTTETEGK